MSIRDRVLERSDGMCEAMVRLPRAWVRCGISPVEDHHALTRSRGGDILDAIGETYHHLACCWRHHRDAHSSGGRGSGLLIDGYVTLDSATGKPVYSGPDAYLTRKYGRYG